MLRFVVSATVLAATGTFVACGGESDAEPENARDDAGCVGPSCNAQDSGRENCLVEPACGEGDLQIWSGTEECTSHCYNVEECGAVARCQGFERGILPDGSLTVEATITGGFGPTAPAGSECGVGERKFSLERDRLTAERCDISQTPYLVETRTRVLGQKDVYRVGTTLAALKQGSGACGADKPFMSIKVAGSSSVSSPIVLVDSFYACSKDPDVYYVDDIDAAFAVFNELAYGSSP